MLKNFLMLNSHLSIHNYQNMNYFSEQQTMSFGVVSASPGALYSICCLGVSTILESENTDDLIALTRKGGRGVGAQPPLFNKQTVMI